MSFKTFTMLIRAARRALLTWSVPWRCQALAGVVLTFFFHIATAAPALEPCRIKGVPREVRCGGVQVAENPDKPLGRQISVRFALVPALAKRAAPDPIFIFAGGPGQSAIAIAPQVLATQALLNARRDLVFVDQRGTGDSNRLGCTPPDPDTTLVESTDSAAHFKRLENCIQQVMAQGHDTRQYATWIAMRDVDAVRAALGVEHINLWAASYGTRAALEYLRQFPAHVRSVVLDGVVPPDAVLPLSFARDNDAALERVIQQCAQTPACNARYPDLSARLSALLAKADAGQLQYTITHPVTGAKERVSLDRGALMSSLRTPLYMPALAAVLPEALSKAAKGDANALIALSQTLSSAVGEGLAEVMHFAVICAEDFPRMKTAATDQLTRFSNTLEDVYRHICPRVPVREVPQAFFAPPQTNVPVLLLSGGADPATPPRLGEALHRQLKNSLHLIAPNLSHGVAHQGCAPELIHRFIRQASLEQQASFEGISDACLKALPAPTFYVAPAPRHESAQ